MHLSRSPRVPLGQFSYRRPAHAGPHIYNKRKNCIGLTTDAQKVGKQDFIAAGPVQALAETICWQAYESDRPRQWNAARQRTHILN
jgi:hypothetical protein